MTELTNQPLVVDNGSGIIKAGFAGNQQPNLVFPSVIGRPKHDQVMVGIHDEDEDFIGNVAEQYRGILKLSYPIEHGVVQGADNWVKMEKIWDYMYNELSVQAEEHPVLLTEAPLNPTKHREKCAEIFFETFNVPSLYIAMQAVLSLYASGNVTGCVLDSGDGVTHAVPIFEGFAINNAIQRIDLAGRDVTEYLQLLLRKSGYSFTTSAEKEVIRSIKEKSCYVAFNPSKEEDELDKADRVKYLYKLPDGSEIELNTERFKAPEILFNPHIVGLEIPGVHECLNYAIQKSDLDIRSTLYDNIVLSGGTTCLNKFGDRLLKEVKSLRGIKKPHIRIYAPPDRRYSTWIGGSILAGLTTFPQMCLSYQQYEELGPTAVHSTFS
eukprot:TRINITY_DN8016_c0_g1_i1.p1 TRINITY_DN8016_c0_g1~~TRINITY_DN8016_c0_g1_i1.p1  ORF type:complete len:381 (+),score=90.49 TRINITY_DN8016_c0_g1_i1:30-1172(+)